MALLHVSFNAEPYLLAEVRISETSEPLTGRLLETCLFNVGTHLVIGKAFGFWTHKGTAEVF